ncbi:MAG: glycosyltransferase, partial [Candidatus Omnitrophica bacterium]|nr:glycosyltransferase [Candidatus Omnitrophota bacterium]
SFSRCLNIVNFLAARLSGRRVKTVMTVISQLGKPAELEPSFGWVIWRILERKVYPKADLLLCNSAASAAEAVNIYGCKMEKVKVVRNFVLIEKIREKILSTQIKSSQEYGSYFLGVGRFVKPKGFEYFLKAFALIRGKINLNLVMAGDGPLLPEMRKLAEQLGISRQVFFLGWVDDVIPLHKNAIALIAPSYHEGLPYSILEALACGTPVVTTRCTSWIDGFEEKGACITVPIGDINSLSEAMLRVATDEGLRKRLGDNAQRVIMEFSKEKVLAEREALLRKVLQ